jgi:anti-anti-sigma factor
MAHLISSAYHRPGTDAPNGSGPNPVEPDLTWGTKQVAGQPGVINPSSRRDEPMQRFEVGAWDDAGVHVVRVSGEFDMAACTHFRDAAERDDAEFVVVDLRAATFIDSCALGELIALQQRTEMRGSRLAILRPKGKADWIFTLTGIDGHLPVYDERVPLLAEFNFG